jgi:hypothetical protein
MKTYRVEFQLGIWACEIEASNEKEAHDRAKEYAIEEIGYHRMKHIEGAVTEVIN